MFKGELHPACFVCYLKIINTVLKDNVDINLKQVVWEIQKWDNFLVSQTVL